MTFRHARGTHKRLERLEWESGRLARENNSAVSRETRKIGARERLVERSVAISRICVRKEVWHDTSTVNVQHR